MSSSDNGLDTTPLQNLTAQYTRLLRQYQQVLDRWTPYSLYRWLGTSGLLTIFMLRILLAQGVSRTLITFQHVSYDFLVVYRSVSVPVVNNVRALTMQFGAV
jgi:hypothetical protein